MNNIHALHAYQGVVVNSFEQALLRFKQQAGVSTDKDVAKLLGLSPTAFNGRKKRGIFPEDKLLALVMLRPDLPIDPDWVMTGLSAKERHHQATGENLAPLELAQRVLASGDRHRRQATLTSDEQELIDLFRQAPLTVKMEAVAVLKSGLKSKPEREFK